MNKSSQLISNKSSQTHLNLFPFGNNKVEDAKEVEMELKEDEDGLPWTDFGKSSFSYIYAGLWVSLLVFALSGVVPSVGDSELLQAILDNPAAPVGVNPYFYGIFNIFAILPIVLACTISPRASD